MSMSISESEVDEISDEELRHQRRDGEKEEIIQARKHLAERSEVTRNIDLANAEKDAAARGV